MFLLDRRNSVGRSSFASPGSSGHCLSGCNLDSKLSGQCEIEVGEGVLFRQFQDQGAGIRLEEAQALRDLDDGGVRFDLLRR
jgi:hypothetical protein